jgi:hypothetical protein
LTEVARQRLPAFDSAARLRRRFFPFKQPHEHRRDELFLLIPRDSARTIGQTLDATTKHQSQSRFVNFIGVILQDFTSRTDATG